MNPRSNRCERSLMRVVALLACTLVLGMASAQEPWTAGTWTDPAGGAELAAVVKPISFGPDGIGAFVCTGEGAGGLGFVLEAEALAASPDDPITMSYNAGVSGDDVRDFASWTREPGGTVVRFAGTDAELATLVTEMDGSVSTAFFWTFGPPPTTEEEQNEMMASGRLVVAVLDSQREELAPALAELPCSLP